MVDHSAFEKLNIQLLGISASNTFSQKMFAASMDLPYPHLSDHPDLGVTRRYDKMKRIGEANKPVCRGSYFLIVKQGIIRGKWINPPGEVFPSQIILEAAHKNLNES
jgi:peroxiredoxin